MEINISLAAEPIFEIGHVVITNAIFTSWIVFFFIIIFFFLASRKMNVSVTSTLQNLAELIIGGLFTFASGIVGEKKAKDFFPLFATIFLYVLFSNWIGLLPGVGTIGIWEEHGGKNILIPFLRSPSGDLNNTFALAIIAVISIQYYGVKYLGLGYFKKFINISNPMNAVVGILELVSEISKLLSFSFRLFGNIFAGEVLLVVIAALLPILGPLPFLGLEIFVGFIQALVFSMLTLVFLGVATTSHH